MKVALGIDESIVDTWFALITITGPVLGVVVGGIIVNCFGGYQNPVTIMVCFIEVILAALCGFPLPFVPTFAWFVFFLWF